MNEIVIKKYIETQFCNTEGVVDMTKDQIRRNEQKLIPSIRYIAVMFVLTLTFMLVKEPDAAQASSVAYTIDYEAQILNASSNSGRVYLSSDNEKTWESLEDSGNIVDISTFLQTKESYIYLKTSNSTVSTKVTLMAEPVNDMTITVSSSGIIYSTGSGSTIEYQKGKNGPWINLGTSGILNTKPMEIKGASLSFRTKALPTRRAGKIVTVKVSKRPSAPSVKFDGSKLSVTGLKAGMQYRTPSGSWLPVTLSGSTNSVNIYFYNGITSITNATYQAPFAATTLEFRTPATDKKAASSSRVVDVPAQPVFSGTVSLVNSTLRVYDTSGKAYEYTLAEPNTTLDINKARWTSLTANKDVIIKNASVNQLLFVRAKSYTDKTTKHMVPASTVSIHTITGITLKSK
jgi:hypothetical protein